MPALTTRTHGPGPDTVLPVFHHRNERVARRAVSSLCTGVGHGSERGERSPLRRGEWHRYAGRRVAEWLHQVTGEPLKAVDLAPWGFPASEVLSQTIARHDEGCEPLSRPPARSHVLVTREAGRLRLCRDDVGQGFAPVHCQRCGD